MVEMAPKPLKSNCKCQSFSSKMKQFLLVIICAIIPKKKTSNLSYETIYFIETINKKKVFTTFSGEIKIDTF